MRVYWLLLVFCCAASPALAQSAERWIAFYGEKARADQFDPYNVILFDSDEHPSVQALKARGKIVIGYLSLGEAEDFRPYFSDIKAHHLLLGANKAWKGHHVVDIRKPEWEDMVLNKLIPHILNQGFDGVMLDTMDSPLDLEDRNPKKFPGMHEAAIRLLADIHQRYPAIQIMLNRGFDILPEAANSITMVLAESTYADSGENGKVKKIRGKEARNGLAAIKKAWANNPSLKVYSLDYWHMRDAKGVARIYTTQRRRGFIPYVSTSDLQHIYPEPPPQ